MHHGFAAELARYGPSRRYPAPPPAAARQYCRRLATTHYENFSVATLLLPRRLVRHFHNVYAYCRWADDLADEAGGGARALALLRWWRDELDACYAGRPHHPVMVALRETVERFHIPKRPFLDLLFAFEQDQLVKRYATWEQLLGYCRYSANPVGHLVLYLLGAYTPDRAALADPICTALQLANFWQDVGRDLDLGRIYLPEEDRRAFGYPDADLHARQFTPAFVELLRYEVNRTRDLFYRGMPLLEKLPAEVRIDVELFLRGGLAVLRKIERSRYNVLHRRPALAKWEKGLLLVGALVRRLRARAAAYRW
jgi:squalene synthase HpnC